MQSLQQLHLQFLKMRNSNDLQLVIVYIVTYPYDGILLSNTKVETDKYNINESRMHYTKSKKPDSNATGYYMIPCAQLHFYDILENAKLTGTGNRLADSKD